MRRLFAALVLASTVSLGAMVPTASAQIPGFQSFGFTGNTPFFATGLNAGVVQCQAGGQINPTSGTVTPFFQATAIAPVPGLGPCVPPIGLGFGLGLPGINPGLGGFNVGGLNGALPGLGLGGTGFFGGIGGLSQVGVTGGVTGSSTIGGLTCIPLGPVIVCQ
jgi:hypothetical protein